MARMEVKALTLMKQLLGMGGLIALRLEECVDALPDQVIPTWSACGPQSTRLNRDDFPCVHTHTNTHQTPGKIIRFCKQDFRFKRRKLFKSQI